MTQQSTTEVDWRHRTRHHAGNHPPPIRCEGVDECRSVWPSTGGSYPILAIILPVTRPRNMSGKAVGMASSPSTKCSA